MHLNLLKLTLRAQGLGKMRQALQHYTQTRNELLAQGGQFNVSGSLHYSHVPTVNHFLYRKEVALFPLLSIPVHLWEGRG
jgi:hypothetical protein